MIRPIEWRGTSLRFLDQTALPEQEVYIETESITDVANAIKTLKVRGAPLIGISAAYGVLLGVYEHRTSSTEVFLERLYKSIEFLKQTRPTATNLFWALERMANAARLNSTKSSQTLFDILEAEAIAIHDEDRKLCEAMGALGATLIADGMTVLTHCNSGSLATGGIGTALGAIKTAHSSGKKIHVFVDETRPLLQGSRLTMWELQQEKIPATLITDNTAAWAIKKKNVDIIMVGADRIAANGDVANKIGTYNLAIVAKEHRIPFYVVIPTSTLDLSLKSGDVIPIEERKSEEVTMIAGKQVAPEGSRVFSPAFDVTPHEYISAIITEKGIHRPPFHESLHQAVKQ